MSDHIHQAVTTHVKRFIGPIRQLEEGTSHHVKIDSCECGAEMRVDLVQGRFGRSRKEGNWVEPCPK